MTMTTRLAVLLAIASTHLPSIAATPQSTVPPLADGVVKRVDQPARRITISHGPLPNGMPAMTMTFAVSPDIPIGSFGEGRRVRFLVDPKMNITRIEPAD